MAESAISEGELPFDVCPLLNDFKQSFCEKCDIRPDITVTGANFDVLAGRCIRNIDFTLEQIELSSIAPENIDDFIDGIILKLDRIITHKYKISSITRQTVDIVISRFTNIHTGFGPARSRLCVEIGNLYFNLKNYKKAIEWYDTALKVNPENKDAWNNKGVATVRLGDVERALRFYDLALKIDDEYEQCWFNKGKALYRLKKLKDAIECFSKVTQINPESICAWNNKGVLLRAIGKTKDAIKCYETAIKIKPDYEWAWHNKGMVLAEMGKREDALRCFNKALSINPDFKPSKDSKELFAKKRKALFKLPFLKRK
jgi:tetratricopeptide (TPR) repeat protein